MPKRIPVVYEGTIPRLLTPRVLINIDYLKSGDYELLIKSRGKVLRRVYFTKS